MMAPNPHWWAQDAKKFYYDPKGYPYYLFAMFGWLGCLIADGVTRKGTAPTGFLWLGIAFFIVQSVLSFRKGQHGGQHLETRFNHITLYRGSELLEHEDMRDVVSLEPTYNSRNGKLKYHVASFPTGRQIKIYWNLDHHDELIEKLQSYLQQPA